MNATQQLGSAIKQLRNTQQLTLQALADAIDSDVGNLSRMERGMQEIKNATLEAIAKALGSTPSRIWQLAEQLTKGVGAVHDAIAPYDSSSNIVPLQRGANLYPLIAWETVGNWKDMEKQRSLKHEYYPCPIECSKNTFVLRVQGISMTPKFSEGDLIFVDPDKPPENNHYVIIKNKRTQQTLLRQLLIEGADKLIRSTNPDWPARITRLDDDYEIYGVVVFKGSAL